MSNKALIIGIIVVVIVFLLFWWILKMITKKTNDDTEKSMKKIKCLNNCNDTFTQDMEQCRPLCPDIRNPTPECIQCVNPINEKFNSCQSNCNYSN